MAGLMTILELLIDLKYLKTGPDFCTFSNLWNRTSSFPCTIELLLSPQQHNSDFNGLSCITVCFQERERNEKNLCVLEDNVADWASALLNRVDLA